MTPSACAIADAHAKLLAMCGSLRWALDDIIRCELRHLDRLVPRLTYAFGGLDPYLEARADADGSEFMIARSNELYAEALRVEHALLRGALAPAMRLIDLQRHGRFAALTDTAPWFDHMIRCPELRVLAAELRALRDRQIAYIERA